MYCTDQAALTLPTTNRNTEATSTDTTNPPVEQESTTWHKYDAGVGNWESDEGGWAPATVLGPRGMSPWMQQPQVPPPAPVREPYLLIA